jgi:hypothetical protein
LVAVARESAAAEAFGERQHDAAEGEQHARPLAQAQALARHESVQAERGERRREIDEHRHARGVGVRQARVNEHEFTCEEQARGEPGAARAVGAEERDAAQARPADQQHGRDDGAQRRLHYERDVGRDPLDRDLLKAPQRREQQHHADRDAVDRRSLLVHCSRLIEVGSSRS